MWTVQRLKWTVRPGLQTCEWKPVPCWGMHKTYRVKLLPEERAYLEHLLAGGKAAARTLTHARVLLIPTSVVRFE